MNTHANLLHVNFKYYKIKLLELHITSVCQCLLPGVGSNFSLGLGDIL